MTGRRLTSSDVRTLVMGLTVLSLTLLGLGLAGQASRFFLGHDHVFGLVPLLNADGEGNLPALFSTALLVLAAGALLATASVDPERGRRVYWALLGTGFLMMAGDEWFGLHEVLTPMLRRRALPGIFFFAWVMLALPALAVIGLVFARFWWKLPPPTRGRLARAASIYILGAVGMEMLSGAYASRAGQDNFPYAVLVSLEEGAEMIGIVVLIGAVLEFRSAVRVPQAPPACAIQVRM